MKKKLFILLGILLITFIPTIVKADNGTFREGEYINNAYIKKLRNGVGTYKHMKFIIRNSDGKVAYCLEPWATLDSSQNYTDIENINELDDKMLDQINLIAFYGYGYGNHTDPIWYSVTQLIIWRTIEPSSEFYFTSSLNGNKTNIYDNFFNEILNLVSNHNSDVLEFDKNQDSSIIGEESNINIINGNILNYEISTKDDLNYVVKNNIITLSSSTGGVKKLHFVKKDNILKTIPLIYKSSYSQNIVTTGSFKPIEKEITLIFNSGSITIIKHDSLFGENSRGDSKLYGAIFRICNESESFYKEVVIPESGSISITDLPKDTYYVKEISPGEGYTLNTDEKIVVVDKEHVNNDIIFTNEVIIKTVTINKSYGTIDATLPEKDVTFEIYRNNIKIITTKTNSNGQIKIKLPYGKYLFHQVNTTDNYDKVDDFYVTIKNDDVTYDLIDYLKVATLIVNKKDFDTNTIINTNEVTFKIVNNDTKKEYYITTVNGIAKLDNLIKGNYSINEIITNNGYTLNSKTYEFNIDDNILNDKNNRFITVDIYNKKISIPNTDIKYNYSSIIFGFGLISFVLGKIYYDKKVHNI